RLQSFLQELPASEDHWNGYGHDLLIELSKRMGKDVKPTFQRYLQDASLQRRWTMCMVLDETQGQWAIEFLAPMLIDKRTGYGGIFFTHPRQYDRSNRVRLCDMAASTISKHNPDLAFELVGEYENVDRQIAMMRDQIARKKR